MFEHTRFSREPVEVTWTEMEGAIAVRLAIHLGKTDAYPREIAELAGTKLSRVSSSTYFFFTRGIAHYEPGRNRGRLGNERGLLTQGPTNRIWLKTPRATMNEDWSSKGMKILPKLFVDRRFPAEQEYDLRELVEEAAETLMGTEP